MLNKRNLHHSSHLMIAGAIYSCFSVTVFVFLLGLSFCTPALSPVGQESVSWHCSCGTLGVGLKRPSVSSLDSSVIGACACMCVDRVHVLFWNYVQKQSLDLSTCHSSWMRCKYTNSFSKLQLPNIFEIHNCEITNCIPETMSNYMNSP